MESSPERKSEYAKRVLFGGGGGGGGASKAAAAAAAAADRQGVNGVMGGGTRSESHSSTSSAPSVAVYSTPSTPRNTSNTSGGQRCCSFSETCRIGCGYSSFDASFHC